MEKNAPSAIERCFESLVHACQCRIGNYCQFRGCHKMKRVIAHTRQCQRKSNGGCPICKQLIALCCYHAKICNQSNCPVHFCQNIKAKLKAQRAELRELSAVPYIENELEPNSLENIESSKKKGRK